MGKKKSKKIGGRDVGEGEEVESEVVVDLGAENDEVVAASIGKKASKKDKQKQKKKALQMVAHEENSVSDDEDESGDDESDEMTKPAATFSAFSSLQNDEEEDSDGDNGVAPAPVTKSSGFAALAMDDEDSEEEETDEIPEQPPKSDNKNVGFAALQVEDDENESEEEVKIDLDFVPSKKSKKKTDKAEAKPAPKVAAESGSSDEEDEVKIDLSFQPKKSKKEKKSTSSRAVSSKTRSNKDSVVDEIQFHRDSDDDVGDEVSAQSKTAGSKTSTKDKQAFEEERSRGAKALEALKAKEKAKNEADELDALLAELEEDSGATKTKKADAEDKLDAAESAAGEKQLTAAERKKLKKKEKKKAAAMDDDFDEIFAAFDQPKVEPKEQAKQEPANEAKLPSASQAMDPEPKDAEEGDGNGAPAQELTAAQKKRLKQKEKQKAAKAAGQSEPATESAAVKQDAKGPKKKESAAVRQMREAIERRKLEQEKAEAARLEAERMAEERIKAEELAEKERKEARERKKEAERLRKEQLRKEGKLLSKSEKERQKKAEQFRLQLIAQGMIPSAAASDSTTEKKTRIVYDNRKRRPKAESAVSEEKSSAVSEEKKRDAVAATESVAAEEAESASREVEIVEEVADAWDDDADLESKARKLALSSVKAEDELDVDHLLAQKADQAIAAVISKPEEEGESGDEETKEDDKSAAEDTEDQSDQDSEDSSEYDSSEDEDSSEEEMDKHELEALTRQAAILAKREEMREAAWQARTKDRLRSPVVCILGHVDTGKTKILDKIRKTNVQTGEAGGITQQIGATFFPLEAVRKEVDKLKLKDFQFRIPALLIIDTPGHESFTNLRTRGSSLCDIAVLVVDIMHGLEPQTIESINLLRQRKNPFVVALNKIDRLFEWKPLKDRGVRESLAAQKKHVIGEFESRVQETKLAFAEIGLNTELYWENPDPRKFISLVPTSAITGEGMPDLLMMLVSLSQKMLENRLMFIDYLQCTVIEVKMIEGLGTTIDVVLTAGSLREGDTIVVCGLDGPVVSKIRGLLTPHPMKEMRVKGQYLHHKKLDAAIGIKIAAEGLEKAVAGTQLLVPMKANDVDEISFLKTEVMKDMDTILKSVDRSGTGVYVQASTLGSLEALLEFLRVSKIPVSGINIGPVNKRDIMKCSTMLERKKEYAVVLAFDVKVERDARSLAEELEIPIFTADIIYHLFDQFTDYMDRVKAAKRDAASSDVIFPAVVKILPNSVFNKKSPIILGVEIEEGILKVGTPLVVQTGKGESGGWLDIGRVLGIEFDKKSVPSAKRGENVAVKIGGQSTDYILYGRHFDTSHTLYSKLSRRSIDLLKEHFRDDLSKDDWITVIKLKKLFDIK